MKYAVTHMSNSMFVRKENGLDLSRFRMLGGIAAEATRDCAQSFAERNRTIVWDVPDFRRKIYGHPKHIGALTMTYTVITVTASRSVIAQGVCVVSAKLSVAKGSNCFFGRCGHVYNWREGNRILT